MKGYNTFEINNRMETPRVDMSADKRRAYREVCTALIFGHDTRSVQSELKDKLANFLRTNAQAAAAGDLKASQAINSVLTVVIEPAILQSVDLFGLASIHHELGYGEVPEIQTWKLVNGESRAQAYNGDVPFGTWEYETYPVNLITISGGTEIDYRLMGRGDFDNRLPEQLQLLTTDMKNKATSYVMDTLLNALKNNTDYVKFYTEYSDTVTQTAVDSMVTKLRHFGRTAILASYSQIATISNWEGYKQVGTALSPFYTEEQVRSMANDGKLDKYKGSDLIEIPNPYNVYKPLADKSGFETYNRDDIILVIPTGIDTPLHTFARGGITSMTGTDVKTGRILNRYDLEIGADVVRGLEYRIGALVKQSA